MTDNATSQAQAEPQSEAKPQKSQGEKLFNRIVYGGLAGVGTFFVTLKAAYELRYGRWNGFYTKSVERLAKYVPQSAAEIAVETTTLMQGGNLMVLPVLAAEKHKVKIVSGLNVMLGDTTPPETVEQSAKQTPMSLIQGRALAWGVVFSTLLTAYLAAKEPYNKFKDLIAQKTYNLAEHFKWNKPDVLMKEAKWYRYGNLAAVDVFATAAAATLLYVGGHFFAKRHEEKKAQQPASRHHGLGMEEAADADIAAAPVNEAAPKPAVSGVKAHAGTVQQVAAQQQLA